MIILKFIILISTFIVTLYAEDNCIRHETCYNCIRKPQCIWCSDHPGTALVRCRNREEVGDSWCRKDFLMSPENHINISKNDQVQTEPTVIQIQPQKVQLKLRLGESVSIPFIYQQANDYPVDLYYLMDLSRSMEPHKAKLSALGSELAKAMRKITKNFRLGFGSYVDKVALPYVNTLSKSCAEKGKICELPYSFRHRMSLSENDETFKELVEKVPMSTNVDAPEGGFDALAQAMVCIEEIGWRQQARRLLVLSTDAPSHLAGDGKLAGIYLPFDGKCYLKNVSGVLEYTQGLRFDYPSLGQINRLAMEENMNVIFAVTSSQELLYKKITEQIRGSSYGILDNDSQNVIKLVLDHYESLTNKVYIVDNAPHEHIQVEYHSKCYDDDLKSTSQCEGIRVRQPVYFDATITALQCPLESDQIWKHEFKIQPQGLEEAIQIEVEVICGCDCDKEGHPGWSLNSTMCSNSPLRCGLCQCPNHLTGRQCECSAYSDISGKEDDKESCRQNSTSEECSGLGTCKCGVCDCIKRGNPNEVISGQFCQCNNYSCKRAGINNLVCSGKDHGTCICGECFCQPGWSGVSCSCRSSNETCSLPGDNKLCSNNGVCTCGECVCHQGYFGTYCQDCSLAFCGEDNNNNQCEEWRPFVTCYLSNEEKLLEEQDMCQENITNVVDVKLVDELPEENSTNWRHCRLPDEQGCTVAFIYSIDRKFIYIQRTRECPLIADFLGVILGVIGSTIIIGLLFLIAWKVVTSIHDQREYIKFEKERAQSKWDRGDNPLYKPSTSTFSNPTFGS